MGSRASCRLESESSRKIQALSKRPNRGLSRLGLALESSGAILTEETMSETTRSKWLSIVLAALGVVCAAAAFAQNPPVVATVDEAKWGPAPPFMPPGAQIAVVS